MIDSGWTWWGSKCLISLIRLPGRSLSLFTVVAFLYGVTRRNVIFPLINALFSAPNEYPIFAPTKCPILFLINVLFASLINVLFFYLGR